MATLLSSISTYFRAKAVGDASISSQVQNIEFARSIEFAHGVLAGQADLLHSQEYTILAGAFVDIDLNGALINPVGVAVNAVKIAAMDFVSDPTNTTNLTIGNAALNAFVGPFAAANNAITIGPGGFWSIGVGTLAGLGTVTPGTADLLRITNSAGATAKIKVGILGRSA